MNGIDRGLLWLDSVLQSAINGRELRELRKHLQRSRDDPERAAKHADQDALLAAIKAALPELETLFKDMQHDYEDGIYRFYHQSFKVYRLQNATQRAVALFVKIGGALSFRRDYQCEFFEAIVRDGTGRVFRMRHNRTWLPNTRPIVEAFLHARYFVEMMIACGRDLDQAPEMLPSGWASVLYLYELR